jgi:thymidylate synthase ThyX
MIKAEIICDSINGHGNRLTTFQLRYPKFVHGEFMTHRAFSRNASSSRAVPVSKNIEEVRSDELRAAPIFWGAEQKGMSPGAELSDKPGSVPWHSIDRGQYPTSQKGFAKEIWSEAAFYAAACAERLADLGAHKSIVNRILEPFLHINVVMSSTDAGLMNFFGLRLDAAADPIMRALAEAVWRVYGESEPQKLQPGSWHLPYIDQDESDQNEDRVTVANHYHHLGGGETELELLIKVSVARCARVSYTSFETGRRSTVEEDLKLYDRLLSAQPLHASPAEHQATPDQLLDGETLAFPTPHDQFVRWCNPHLHGNFVGWIQHRKQLSGEAVAPLPEAYR